MENEMETGVYRVVYRGYFGIMEKKMETTGGFSKSEVPFWGRHNKDCKILGSILGFLILGNYHMDIQKRIACLMIATEFSFLSSNPVAPRNRSRRRTGA